MDLDLASSYDVISRFVRGEQNVSSNSAQAFATRSREDEGDHTFALPSQPPGSVSQDRYQPHAAFPRAQAAAPYVTPTPAAGAFDATIHQGFAATAAAGGRANEQQPQAPQPGEAAFLAVVAFLRSRYRDLDPTNLLVLTDADAEVLGRCFSAELLALLRRERLRASNTKRVAFLPLDNARGATPTGTPVHKMEFDFPQPGTPAGNRAGQATAHEAQHQPRYEAAAADCASASDGYTNHGSSDRNAQESRPRAVATTRAREQREHRARSPVVTGALRNAARGLPPPPDPLQLRLREMTVREAVRLLRAGEFVTKFTRRGVAVPRFLQVLDRRTLHRSELVSMPHLCWSVDRFSEPSGQMPLLGLEDVATGPSVTMRRSTRGFVIGVRDEELPDDLFVTAVFPERTVDFALPRTEIAALWVRALRLVVDRNRAIGFGAARGGP